MNTSLRFENVALCTLRREGNELSIHVDVVQNNLTVSLIDKEVVFENGDNIPKFNVHDYDVFCMIDGILKFARKRWLNTIGENSYLLRFSDDSDSEKFMSAYTAVRKKYKETDCKIPLKRRHSECAISSPSPAVCEFDARTDPGSAQEYFQFYGMLWQQQNMMQDNVRTSTYQSAILQNADDFRNKVVLDVGAGSGILSFFAAKAGAKKVYAVEASSMATYCKNLVSANNKENVIKVLADKVERVDLPEKVDTIISEPMGYMLINERMLESFMNSRRFLKPGGRLFPTVADMHFALFTDDLLYLEQVQRAAFWFQNNFYGIDLRPVEKSALMELLRQPVVDGWSPEILVSRTAKWSINFEEDPVEKLHNIRIPIKLAAVKTCHVHGIATWFDVGFHGSNRDVWLSTAPSEPLTHWYQVRCLVPVPLFVNAGQFVEGFINLTANEKQSYDIEISLSVNGTTTTNQLDLKAPHFRGINQTAPAGTHKESPSNAYVQDIPLPPASNSANTNGNNAANVSENGESINGRQSVSSQSTQSSGTSARINIESEGMAFTSGQQVYDQNSVSSAASSTTDMLKRGKPL